MRSSFIQIPKYNLIRNDVAGKVAKHGVCAYVKDNILTDSVTTPLPNVLTFHVPLYDVHIILVYRPPSNSIIDNENLLSFIEQFSVGKEIVCLGDFNLPNLSWNSDIPTDQCTPLERSFFELFNNLGMLQWVKESTYPRSGNILDLMFTSEDDRVGMVDVLAPLPGCDHCPTLIEYTFSDQTGALTTDAVLPKRDWPRGRYGAISRALNEFDWDTELAYFNAEESLKHFSTIVTGLTEIHVPLKAPKDSKPPWATRPPTSLVHRRQAAWSAFKNARLQLGRHSTGAGSAYAVFTAVNREYRCFSTCSQVDYEKSLIYRSKEQPKILHSYIRNKKLGRPSVGPLKLETGLCDNPQIMAESFALAFASVFTRGLPPDPAGHQLFDGHVSFLQISRDDVYALLSDLDGNSAMGPDGIHPLVLKRCAAQIAYPLHVIYNRSLHEGLVPSAWKESLVIPIYKKGPRYDPLNYRPISLTSTCSKTMERIICSHLRAYLEANSLLSPNQFGFRPGRSTMDQLLLVYNEVSYNTDRGGITDVILFDFSKAFDVVSHDLMIVKLGLIGIKGCLLQWIASFLKDRKMRVSIKGHVSQPRDVLSGVPQGSVLGPLLFLIYINNIAAQLTCSYKIFADDLKIYTCVHQKFHDNCATSTAASVQADIHTLSTTALSWGLKMNTKKCAVLRFPRPHGDASSPNYFLSGQQIPSINSHEDLGVLVDNELKFHSHIHSVVHKAGGLAHSFLKSTVCRSPDFMTFLLTTHIRPILEYCSCLWHTGYITDLRLLEGVQRRWTKHIDGMSMLSYAERLHALQLFSVKGRLLRADLIYCWKLFNGKCSLSVEDLFQLSTHTHTRGHCHKIFAQFARTDVRRRFFSVRCVPLWNSLPADVVCAPDLSTFKRMLTTCLRDQLYDYDQLIL